MPGESQAKDYLKLSLNKVNYSSYATMRQLASGQLVKGNSGGI